MPAAGWSVRRGSWLFSSDYPIWFRMLIGVLEVAAAARLVWPRTAAFGAAIIILVMLGGMGTHAFQAGDMRDVLLASSSGDFFTTHHYGRGRFERDAAGRVARLVYTEGPHEFVADRL
jgi:uncharacterized membrane protein YccC